MKLSTLRTIIKEETRKAMRINLKESNFTKVTKDMWAKMSQDERANAALSAVKDPDEAEDYVDLQWSELPSQVASNMHVYQGNVNEESETDIDNVVDAFNSMLNERNLIEQQNTLNELFVWTPAASKGVAAIGAAVGLGPLLSHFVLLGGVALAFASPLIKREYQSLLQSIKGRKLTSPAAFEAFKTKMIAAAKNLPAGQRAYVTRSLNDILKYSRNKEYERAFNTAQQLITYLR